MHQRNITYIAIVVAVAFLLGYIYIYQYSPFSEDINSILLYLADPIASLLAAVSLTAVWLCYQRDDKPYAVWVFFTLGGWFWFIAETIYSVLSYQLNDYPPLGWADISWFVGYALVSLALYHQYQILQKTKNAVWVLVGTWVGLLLLTPLILLVLQSEFTIENLVAYLYPVVDFAICLVSLRLYMVFGGGKLSRPWIGLFVLGISDAIWAWQYAAGADSNIYADASYVAAYLILALGFFRQYLLLRFGPE